LVNVSAKERLDELEARKADLEINIVQAELARPKYTKDEIVRWVSQFKNCDLNNINYKRNIIDILQIIVPD